MYGIAGWREHQQRVRDIENAPPAVGSPMWARIEAARTGRRALSEARRTQEEDRAGRRGEMELSHELSMAAQKPWLEAMTETQRRAAEDRERALGEIRGREEKGIGALDPWKQDIEAWTPESEEALYEQSRTGIEAGTQAQMREMQEGFAPGGFRQSQMAGAREGMTGRLAQARMAARGTRREDMLKLMGEKSRYGKEVAGLYERGGRTLADLYGKTITKTPDPTAFARKPATPRAFAAAG